MFHRHLPFALAALLALSPAAHAQSDTPAADTPAAEAPAADAPAADTAQPEAPREANGINPQPGELAMGQEVGQGNDGVGSTYVEAEFGDWQQRCVRTDGGKDPCQLYQLLRDDNDNAVAEFSIFALPAGGQAEAGATVITPLETLLTREMTIGVDQAKPKRYPYTFCAAGGCFARIGFTAADVTAFKAGASATVTIVPAAAPDEEVTLKVSLSGFTAGYEAVKTANAE